MIPVVTAILVITIISACWFCFESRWDDRLFANGPGRVCENLRARAAMELLRARADVQVLDVRSASEYAAGALPDAMNLAFTEPGFNDRLAGLDKSRPVLVYCAGGYRSRKAVERLVALGFESIHHLHRGFHSWRIAGLPIRNSRSA